MNPKSKYVAYYRVSTQRQGQSGLGLSAQKDAVNRFLSTQESLLEEFTDIESGKSDTRPQLKKAIELVQKQGATLLIAKLDRLSRNLSFISALMDSKVKFIAVDMPDANELTIHIFGSLGQWERKKISERTREALAQLKKKGKKLGTPSNWSDNVRMMGTKKLQEIARSNENNIKSKKIAFLLRKDGKTLWEIANELNENGFRASRGGAFDASQVRRLLKTNTPQLC